MITNKYNQGVSHPQFQHGLSKHRVHKIWTSMMTRCYNPNSIGYKKHYGSKGIRVCDKWHTFINFYNDVIGTYRDGLTIDRFPNKEGNYQPDNFRWVTPKEQTRNVSCNIIVEYDGLKMCVGELCERTGLPYTYLYGRIVTRGWSVQKALETPSRFSKGRGYHAPIILTQNKT